MSGLLLAWMAEAGLITARSFKANQRPPLPSDFVASFVIFGAFGLMAEVPQLRTASALAGWGIVVATALQLGPAVKLDPKTTAVDSVTRPAPSVAPTTARGGSSNRLAS